MITIKEAVDKIREAGPSNVRITPDSVKDKVNLQIKTPAGWVSVMSSVDRKIAEDIVNQSQRNIGNRVILG